ncbi:unnamed protein product [Diatraea saccharalis]|uniref:Uncharacterized protein n=1 Tax=Diatraea saccharalis TaxID=40085 RepID=A0A9N9WFI2_9NEOP|nr:unnamed protein product [Diatraea saccharalis]
MFSENQSDAVRYLKHNRLEDIDQNLRNVTKNVLEIEKRNVTTKSEMRIKLAKLKKEKLDTLALVARCHAALASMEVIIAENELCDQLNLFTHKDSKRKCSKKSDESDARLKKNKTSESKVSNKKRPSDKRPYNSKASRKPSQKSSNDNFTRTKEIVQNGAVTVPLTKDKKEDNMANKNKENCNNNPLLSVGKQIIILSQPPLRKDTNSNKIGYLSETHQLKPNKVQNSIYDIVESTDNFGNMLLTAASSYHRQHRVRYQNPATDINHNQTAISNQNLAVSNGNQSETICNQNQATIHNQTYRDETYFNYYNKVICGNEQSQSQDTIYETNYHILKEENVETEQSGQHFQTTNAIFKDIMNKKGFFTDKVIKIENDCHSDITSEKTFCFDVRNNL